MRLVITGGGTGGHIYPGLSLAAEVEGPSVNGRVLFLGSTSGLETRLVPGAGFDLRSVPAAPLPRRFNRALLRSFRTNREGYIEALKVMDEWKPDAVLGMGGYVSVPGILAARRRRVPIAIHEQNARPGLANRLLARFAKEVFLAWPDTRGLKGRVVGIPVRSTIGTLDKSEAKRRLGLAFGLETILAFGGSRGARSINGAVKEMLRVRGRDLKGVQILWAAGEDLYEETERDLVTMGVRVDIRPYIEEMPWALAAADIAVTRAGALTVAELAAAGLGSILVPYPHATNNHQGENAAIFASHGAAVVVRDEDLNGSTLFEAVAGVLERKKEMGDAAKRFHRPNSASTVVRILREMTGETAA